MRRLLLFTTVSLLILFVSVMDQSLFPAIGGSFRAINLTLTLSIYTLIIIDKHLALLLFGATTLLSALLGNTLIAFHLLIGLGVLLIMDWIFESFLTNRSYYTLLILGTLGWFAYYLLFALTVIVLGLFETTFLLPQLSLQWVSQVFFGSLVLIILLSIAYLLTNFLSKKFRSYFIIS